MSDDESLPMTVDTGEQPQADKPDPEPPPTDLKNEPAGPKTDLTTDEEPALEPIPTPAPSVTVPGRYQYLKWWQFILMLVAVWIPAAAIGPGLFYWWTQDQSAHKTPVIFVTLVYVVACTVVGLMLAMVPDRPLLSALAIAVMSAVFASLVAAAPFYGAFYCDHTTGPCLGGIIPY